MAEARVPVMCIDHGGADVRCVRIQVVPNSEVRGKFTGKMMALSVQPDGSVDWLVRDEQCTHEHRSHTKPHVCACSLRRSS